MVVIVIVEFVVLMLMVPAEQVFSWPQCGRIAITHSGFSHLLTGHQDLLHQSGSHLPRLLQLNCIVSTAEVLPTVHPGLFGSGEVRERRCAPHDEVRVLADFE